MKKRLKDSSPNARKSWTEDDIREVLRLYVEKGKTPPQIHALFGRSLSSIKMIITGFNAVREGRPNTFLSDGIKRVMLEYLAQRKEQASSEKSPFIKHEQAPKVAPVVTQPTSTEVPVETKKRIDAVGAAFDALKIAVADLVEYEVDRGAEQKIKEVQAELQELREFKQKAKDANPAGFITARLFGSKQSSQANK